jgi:endogenous inhibitor of DNA gyrase (YacG/DUF329 family)
MNVKIDEAVIEPMPCPFCRGEGVAMQITLPFWSVRCRQCLSGTGGWLTREKAIAAWNTRVAADRTSAEIAPVERLTTAGMPIGDREALARVIDPISFNSWQSMYDHCLRQGDDAETARRYADGTYLPNMNRAREKADAILPLLERRDHELARLISELLAIIRFGQPGFIGDIHVRRARRVIEGLPAAIAAGEADYRAYRAAEPKSGYDGTPEELATVAHMLEEYGPECFPANELGQVDFARCMMDAAAACIRASLSAVPPMPPASSGPTLAEARVAEGLAKALEDLRDACLRADALEELHYEIDGSLLDAAQEALKHHRMLPAEVAK